VTASSAAVRRRLKLGAAPFRRRRARARLARRSLVRVGAGRLERGSDRRRVGRIAPAVAARRAKPSGVPVASCVEFGGDEFGDELVDFGGDALANKLD
jgi:hypothetical protein